MTIKPTVVSRAGGRCEFQVNPDRMLCVYIAGALTMGTENPGDPWCIVVFDRTHKRRGGYTIWDSRRNSAYTHKRGFNPPKNMRKYIDAAREALGYAVQTDA